MTQLHLPSLGLGLEGQPYKEYAIQWNSPTSVDRPPLSTCYSDLIEILTCDLFFKTTLRTIVFNRIPRDFFFFFFYPKSQNALKCLRSGFFFSTHYLLKWVTWCGILNIFFISRYIIVIISNFTVIVIFILIIKNTPSIQTYFQTFYLAMIL